jgi:outer membrane receptor for ferrienterochelin and colicin
MTNRDLKRAVRAEREATRVQEGADGMATITLDLLEISDEQAAEIAAAIREAGSLQFTSVEGNTVNVQIGGATAQA